MYNEHRRIITKFNTSCVITSNHPWNIDEHDNGNNKNGFHIKITDVTAKAILQTWGFSCNY